MSKKLSKQQQRRINRQHRHKLDGCHADDVAIVVSHLGYQAIVSTPQGMLAADWRKSLGDIAVNDRVLIHQNSDHHAVIEAIFPREKTLYKWQGRKMKAVASHIDQLVVVIAAKPAWQPGLLDRYLIAAHVSDIPVSIVCNKVDLLNTDTRVQWLHELSAYQALGYPILPVSVHTGEGISSILSSLQGKETVICGQSGVGKSSLISTLIPNCDIWVQSLSTISELGKHTTTNARRYPLDDGAVIDTPGVRGFAITHLSVDDIISGFPDIAPFIGYCQFSNCRHRTEPNCAVRQAYRTGKLSTARYNSFMQILEECTHER